MTNTKEVLINDELVTTEYLLKQSEKLTSLASRVELIHKMLANVAYQKTIGDEEAIFYFVNANLNCLTDNLVDIADQIQEISDSVCPD